ncbi:glycoside hydrolase family protein [Maritalea myrionectae]|uniref:glycoside hydrolase family protein n=1 Tax=Maritalea myrionectae TaxID=454601 RepID=UPI00040A620E|nr:peptidoglycan-binding protein [Maritalea myrionectae]
METSIGGRAYMRGHEGEVLTCYLDPAGVPTIGTGATLRSRVAYEFFGGKLIPGVTKITKAQSDKLFRAMLKEEYEPPVRDGMPGANQHEFDAGVDCCYNMGPRSLNWNWAKLWRAGKKTQAATYLATHYHKANGKVLAGLVRRRRETAQILLHGIYPAHVMGEGVPRKRKHNAPDQPDPVVKEAQQILTKRGFNPGAIDGWMGQRTKSAVLAYQEAHPHLVNDGILGPATLAQLRRDAQAAGQIVKDTASKGAGGGLFAGVAAFFSGLPWGWIVAWIVLAVFVWAAWRYRDVFIRRFNSMRNKVVTV